MKQIEQSYSTGPYYLTSIIKNEKNKDVLSSKVLTQDQLKKVSVSKSVKVKIGSTSHFEILKLSGKILLFSNQFFMRELKADETPSVKFTDFYLQIGKLDNEEIFVWSKDTLNGVDSKIDFHLTPNKLTLPVSISGFAYQQKFAYNNKFIDKIKDLSASIVDSFKRPLDLSAIKRNRYYPARISDSNDKVSDVVNHITTMPLVVDLSNSPYACLDLEPTFTQKDLALAESFDYYYKEETVHHGKHYLIKIGDDKAFKYRLTSNLECQVNTMITWYGINGEFVKDNVEISNLSEYKSVGSTNYANHKYTSVPEVDVSQEMEIIERVYSDSNYNWVLDVYNSDDDISHADFTAMARLLSIDRHYLNYLHTLPLNEAVNTLSTWAGEILPWRAKFETERDSMPYLTYLANIIISRKRNVVPK